MCVCVRTRVHIYAHAQVHTISTQRHFLRYPVLGAQRYTQVQVHTLQACMCASKHTVLAGHTPSHCTAPAEVEQAVQACDLSVEPYLLSTLVAPGVFGTD